MNRPTKKRKNKNFLSEAEIIEQAGKRDLPAVRKFQPNVLVDNILVELIDSSHELHKLKDIPTDITDFENSFVRDKYIRDMIRKGVLTEKVNFLSGLMVA